MGRTIALPEIPVVRSCPGNFSASMAYTNVSERKSPQVYHG